MNPSIQIKPASSPILIALAIVCVGLLPQAQGVVPPPVGGYDGKNTATGKDALFSLTTGVSNTANGFQALFNDTSGSANTAIGASALQKNTTAHSNTAIGVFALSSNTEGTQNTATGVHALALNTTGSNNTANGTFALRINTTGTRNTATGISALLNNDTGNNNTANGAEALHENTDGDANTANGAFALFNNSGGAQNTATGVQALLRNTNGTANTANGVFALQDNTADRNTAVGFDALGQNTTGGANTATGYSALLRNTTGNINTALGVFAGWGVTTASNVIAIGSLGANVSNSTWIGNVYGVVPQSATTAPVVVSNGGQLGIVASSERFKKDIVTMEKASEAILSLRPVTFHYKSDVKDMPQFGLIAEEVAKVNRALVLPDREGKPYSVRYDQVNAMLLNEFLKEHRKVESLEKAMAQQRKENAAIRAMLNQQAAQIQKVSAQLELNKSAPQTVQNNR
jgi:hypothetical protein